MMSHVSSESSMYSKLVINHIQSTREQNMRFMDNVEPLWMQNCDEF